mmetsp:Transcript_70288/g.199333  ORF Transcript_70288/g.199333 Transcript_70288/m.199333 type:complete len:208 (+) Transcript_70288:606-1229(+)
MSVTSALCFRMTWAQSYELSQSAPFVQFQTRAVASCEAESSTSFVGWKSTAVTFFAWPVIFCTVFSFSLLKRITCPSTPPVRMRLSSVLCTSRQRTPGAVDWCAEWVPVHASLCTSATGARLGKCRCFRVLERLLAMSVMRCTMSGVRPVSASSRSAAAAGAAEAAAEASSAGRSVCSWSRSCATCPRAASRSFSSRAMTRQAASCW